MAAQVRLLRILQDGQFERVGGERQLHVDIRIVAATHRDMHELVSDGRFREDLWYRIAVFPIRLPPLRERVDDIPVLAVHFAPCAARRLGTAPLVPSPLDIKLLVSYPWPGNVRELAAVIERAAILGDGKSLEIAKALGGPGPPAPIIASGRDNGALPPAPAGLSPLNDVMARHIESALAHARPN